MGEAVAKPIKAFLVVGFRTSTQPTFSNLNYSSGKEKRRKKELKTE
jgi:hypothetical protein